PPVDIVLHQGSIAYSDEGARKPFTAEVNRVSGSGRLRGVELALELQAMRDADVIKASVAYDLAAQRGSVQARADGLSLPYWLDRFAYAPEWALTAGRADLDVTLAWQDPMIMDELEIRGTARVYGGEARLQNVAVPVKGLRGYVAFNQDLALVQSVEATIDRMPLRAAGRVHRLVHPDPALGLPDPRLELTVTAPAVDVARFPTLFPALTHWPVVGTGELVATVTGTSMDPHVALEGSVPAGSYAGEPLADFALAARYRHGGFDIDRFFARAATGTLAGSVGWRFPEDPKAEVPVRVDARFQGLDLAGLLERHLDEPPPVALAGRLSGTYDFSFDGVSAESGLNLALQDGRLAGMPVDRFEARYESATPGWKVPALTLSLGETLLTARAEGRDDGAFSLAFEAPRAELAQLARLAPEPLPVTMRGQAMLEGTVEGRLGEPATWTGRASARAPHALVERQPVEAAAIALSLADNRLSLVRATAGLWRGEVQATGVLWPFVGDEALSRARYDVTARGLALDGALGLPAELAGLSGQADATAAVTVDGPGVEAAGRAAAASLAHARWGRLDRVEADFGYRPDRLSVSPLVWRQGEETVTATGHWALGDRPALDMRVKAEGAEVQTLLGAVRWPEVVAALNPKAAARKQATGPRVAIGGLPTSAGAPWTLDRALDHWQAYRKLPLDRPPPAPPVLPFWEGTTGELSFDMRLSGPVAAPAVSLHARARQLRLFDRLLDDAELDLGYQGDRLTLPTFRLREGGRTVLTAGGTLGPDPAQALVVRTYGLDLGWTDRLLRQHKAKLSGTADMRLALSGPLSAPRLEAEGTLRDGRFESAAFETVPFDRVEASLAHDRDSLAIRRARLVHLGREVSLSGLLPVGDGEAARQAPLDLSLVLEGDNLALINHFDQGNLEWLGGQGRVALKLGGTVAKPSLGGKIQLRDARIRLDGLDTPVEKLMADVELNDRQITVKALKGRYGGGDVSLYGEVLWNDLKPEQLDLAAVAKPFRLRTPDGLYDGMVEANMHLTGSVAQPVLGGTVALWDGVVALQDAVSQGEGAAPLPWRLGNLQVSLGPNLRIKNALIDLIATTQHQGHLRVDGPIAAPQPRGLVVIES
ncbi:MAG: translocation/assembly module TamB domain-containing protein, partial [Candidatus Sericytochromatia bacterium]